MFCMENVLTQFEDNFYSQTTGIITGDNDSFSIDCKHNHAFHYAFCIRNITDL